MTALAFAWRKLVRQPARAALGVLGVAAVGALLLDMLLLSEGLVSSMRDLLDRTGFDIRITATDALPGTGPRMVRASAAAASLTALPAVRSAVAVRVATAEISGSRQESSAADVHGATGGAARPWTVLRGRDVHGDREVVVNDALASAAGLEPGSTLVLRASCPGEAAAPPPVTRLVAGIAEFPFQTPDSAIAAGTLAMLEEACGAPGTDEADLLLVASAADTGDTAAAVRAARPDLHVATNEQLIGRFRESGFTYFRQISAVLSAVTITFALLLITVLLTVSVNQRLGEIAALRALGFSRRRVVSDVLCESSLIVGMGGLLSLPLGLLLATWLDGILKRMPGIPSTLHFFVFDRDALVVHLLLLAVTALAAALYPMVVVARLPIAATLRNEVVS